jgi:flagellar basal-body rod protein FlgB
MCKRRASGGAARTARQALAARARDVVHLSARRVPGCCLAGDAQLLARVLLYRVQAFAPGDESMPVNLDAYLGVHQDALRLYGRRTAVLANNLANADTPGFKAQDLDFKSLLGAGAAGAGGALPLTTTHAVHVSTTAATAPGTGSGLKYRVPLAPSLDGNTVDPQLEQAAFADNTVRYQAALTFLSDKFKSLMTAITGQ